MSLNITVVCEKCHNHDKEPAIEINFRDSTIYYLCPICKKDSRIVLKVGAAPFPKTRLQR